MIAFYLAFANAIIILKPPYAGGLEALSLGGQARPLSLTYPGVTIGSACRRSPREHYLKGDRRPSDTRLPWALPKVRICTPLSGSRHRLYRPNQLPYWRKPIGKSRFELPLNMSSISACARCPS